MMDRVQKNGGKATYAVIGTDIKSGHHNRKFDIDESDMIKGVKLLATLCFEFQNSPWSIHDIEKKKAIG